jgi:aspartyl-tRNA(Asn)/glutamyl-tRNA(Gln) amidotransferase subunit A
MYGSYEELCTAIKPGKVTLEDAVKFYLSNIEKGKHLGAFLSVYGEEAVEKAKKVDEKIKNGTAGRLAGMVIAVKDVLAIKDKEMTCASKILENFVSLYTCTAVQRLMKMP